MAAPFSFTQTETFLGTLTNGLKLVLAEITITDGGIAITDVSIKSLQRVLGFVIGFGKPANDTLTIEQDTEILNRFFIKVSGDSTGDIYQILAIGF